MEQAYRTTAIIWKDYEDFLPMVLFVWLNLNKHKN